MRLRHLWALLWLMGSAEGCRLATAPPAPQKLTPATPVGSALLFKYALDSARFADALFLLAYPDGSPLRPSERYEWQPALEWLTAIVGGAPLTMLRQDSLAPDRFRVLLELDHLNTLEFTLVERERTWRIVYLRRLPWRREPVEIFPGR
jgi:hypothetical protein